MEIIKEFLYMAKDYWLLSIIISTVAAYLESFIPIMPLTGIVALSAAVNGLVIGFVSGWIGSCLGAISVFFLLQKVVGDRFLERISRKVKKENYDKVMKAVEKREFGVIFLYYMLPFLPSTLMTVIAGICEIDYKVFIPPMVFGKFIMMFVASYVGSDISGFINNPTKLVVLLVVIAISYLIAYKFKSNLEKKDMKKGDKNVR
ncbi:TVP38/TMEM64 family protein [Peptostreptococcus canis]|uniref:TVP38/TMEM64 family membrane protein n=1 Tax=Peptostreptococcus canis TaxID=1159213 RepID=A0ABR6TK34_9FIRM|nr:VTT domain-containing protein [Peptostreptococcus canis]MBC2575767.1 TVP38/TMEM64 family protein [Peptostreptococcus canis]MBP1998118.1 putative membrane protein YdjX (TVP38/TMEM64 family) [Peptostreptococcus canis]